MYKKNYCILPVGEENKISKHEQNLQAIYRTHHKKITHDRYQQGLAAHAIEILRSDDLKFKKTHSKKR
jgi:hypothetical protein